MSRSTTLTDHRRLSALGEQESTAASGCARGQGDTGAAEPGTPRSISTPAKTSALAAIVIVGATVWCRRSGVFAPQGGKPVESWKHDPGPTNTGMGGGFGGV